MSDVNDFNNTGAIVMDTSHPDRNLGMELVRATEAASIRGVKYVGKGDKNAADGAAVGT